MRSTYKKNLNKFSKFIKDKDKTTDKIKKEANGDVEVIDVDTKKDNKIGNV